jgi:glycosyltransferase involved in cell wall biosynthesis
MPILSSRNLPARRTKANAPLAIVQTHPVQYHAPVWRRLAQHHGIPVSVVYGADFSVAGYHDADFSCKFAWDVDLLGGYQSLFLSRVSEGGESVAERVSPRGLRAAMDRIEPGAVLLTGYGSPFHRAALREALLRRRLILFRAETTDRRRANSHLPALVRDGILRAIYSRFSKVLYIGNESRSHYKRLGVDDSRLTFSPYCVDSNVFQCSERDRVELRAPARLAMGVGERDVVVLFSGKLIPRKAPRLLLEAAIQAANQYGHQLILVYLGNGPLREELENHAKQSFPGNVRFLGFQNQSQLSRFYHAADMLVLPSDRETWGLVVNEALHHGLPCIVSEGVGCAADLIEPGATGETFACGSATCLTEAITRALSLVKQPETRTNCRKKVAAYTVGSAAAGIAEALGQLHQTNGRR